MSYTLKENLANKSNYGSKRDTSSIKYIVIHYTGNDGDTDESNATYFKNNIVKASAHYFVDDDSVTQSVPDDYVAWSVGGSKYSDCDTTGGGKYYGKCTNSNSISIELCDDVKNGTIYPSSGVIANAIELTKTLMKKYGISASYVIRHFDVNGKHCPAYWCCSTANDTKWKTEFHDKLTTTTTSTSSTTTSSTSSSTTTTTSTSSTTTSSTSSSTSYYNKYTGSSAQIDVVFKAIGVPSKYYGNVTNRKTVAKANGYSNYTGTSEQNLALIKLAKNGKLKKPTSSTTTTTSVSYFKACASKYTSLVDGLKSIGVTSTLAYRKKIAVANSIVTSESKYTGQSTYNSQMLSLLKKGKLIKP